jgi:NAD(P)-dependent dehydrogenase (short-subunit alcohol dehydrogenase family)
MLSEKIILITGATGGVGPALGRAALADGAFVVATARTLVELDDLRDTLGASPDRWLSASADLANEAEAMALVEAAVSRFGGLDVVWALAGGWRGGDPISETAPAVLEWLWRINLLTAFNTCRAALPHLISRGWGRIITFGARAAMSGQARSGAYAASKAAVVALTQSIAAEVKTTGVTANVILPATIDTPANRAAMPNADYSKWVTPEQIAATVRFLSSHEASAINGASIPVYGRA